MAVPTYDQPIEPILHLVAASSAGDLACESRNATADPPDQTDSPWQELISIGQAICGSCANKAHQRRKLVGLPCCIKRRHWKPSHANNPCSQYRLSYGANRNELQCAEGSGADRVVYFDKLGLQKWYVKAKDGLK